VTDARIEKVFEDRVGAREFLSQADDFLKDSALESLGAAS
jgi:hypothetical protein